MDGAKGKPTMRDISHGISTVTVAGGVDSGNLEPLIKELIQAVRGLSLTVNVPPVSSPDVVVNVPAVAPPAVVVNLPALSPPDVIVNVPPADPGAPTDHGLIVEALKGLKMPTGWRTSWEPPDVTVHVPKQRLMGALLFSLLSADLALRILEILRP
jgi:hypothetical protein